MDNLINQLNQNQGLLAAIAILISIIGGIYAFFFRKGKDTSVHKNSPYITSGRDISAGGDIIVGGHKTTHYANEQKPVVVIKGDGFTYTKGRLDLIFENTGHATAVIKNFNLAEDNTHIEEFSLGPQGKVRKQFNVSGFKVLKEKLDNPNFELIYKDFLNNKRYKTVGYIDQEPRADGNYNLGKIKDITFLHIDNTQNMSTIESKILEKLYKHYKETGEKTKWKAVDAYQELNIKNGQDISPLHDSKFVEIVLDGTHECFMITTEGIRYMDNQ